MLPYVSNLSRHFYLSIELKSPLSTNNLVWDNIRQQHRNNIHNVYLFRTNTNITINSVKQRSGTKSKPAELLDTVIVISYTTSSPCHQQFYQHSQQCTGRLSPGRHFWLVIACHLWLLSYFMELALIWSASLAVTWLPLLQLTAVWLTLFCFCSNSDVHPLAWAAADSVTFALVHHARLVNSGNQSVYLWAGRTHRVGPSNNQWGPMQLCGVYWLGCPGGCWPLA